MVETVDMFIEIPGGSRNKYEWDATIRRFRLDRMLFSAVHYPGDYGFVPGTLAEDGDALDGLVLLGEPTFPGCIITARVVGVFWMTDEKGPDAKLITVPDSDPRWLGVQDLVDIPRHLLDEIGHFFSIYKNLENKDVQVEGFGSRAQAWKQLDADRERYRTMDNPPAMPW